MAVITLARPTCDGVPVVPSSLRRIARDGARRSLGVLGDGGGLRGFRLVGDPSDGEADCACGERGSDNKEGRGSRNIPTVTAEEGGQESGR